MTKRFSECEIIEMAVQIEKNGRDFYNELAARSGNREAKDIFRHLASEEENHIKAFTGILEAVCTYKPPEAYPDEYFSYMRSLAGQYVFTQKDKGREIAGQSADDKKALDLGIGFEKESIVFYEEMKKMVPVQKHGTIDELIAQEREHLRSLCLLKYKLEGTGCNGG